MSYSSKEFLETREAEEDFTETNEYIELNGMHLTVAKFDFVIEKLQKKINELKEEIDEN